MIYGEITEDGRFRFISAGHQPPAVFSHEFGHFVKINPDRLVSFPPVGLLPPSNDLDDPAETTLEGKRGYEVNEISLLARGDILLLLTDGLAEHDEGRFYPTRVEELFRDHPDCSSAELCEKLRAEILEAAAPNDDVSFVVIRRTR
jgi:serine phosphatase RsbU (regulator of sigma subunit)